MRRLLLLLVSVAFIAGCASHPVDLATPAASTHRDSKPAHLRGPDASPGALACYSGDANRVQGVYAVAAGKTDRYATVLSQLKSYAASVDAIFNNSAVQTGGTAHIRWVQDPSTCEPVIDHVVIPAGSDGSFGSIRDALKAQGYTRTDRHYVVWSDGGSLSGFCGQANIMGDSQPGQANLNNTSGFMGVSASGCWGGMIEAHELSHTLGAVQLDAPHTTGGWHCTDEYDRMCEQGSLTYVCPSSGESILDCNHDDYFRAALPPAGTYLASHWNVADSPYLVVTYGSGATPTPTTTSPTPTPTTSSPPPSPKPCKTNPAGKVICPK